VPDAGARDLGAEVDALPDERVDAIGADDEVEPKLALLEENRALGACRLHLDAHAELDARLAFEGLLKHFVKLATPQHQHAPVVREPGLEQDAAFGVHDAWGVEHAPARDNRLLEAQSSDRKSVV